jgi:DNA/RNA endonuclease YhcR with UshA esterase domain
MRTELIAAIAAVAGCKKAEPVKETAGSKPAPVAASKAPPPLASKEYFRVDAGPRTPCVAGKPCEARIVLTALGDYHVNERYPFKLEADAVPGLAVEGTGSWTLDDAKTGTLTVRYTPAKAGPAKLAGTFKLSVCTDENCMIEAPKIALDVTAN